MGERGAVQLVCGAHHFLGESGCSVSYERDVITQFHCEAARGLNTCIRQQADGDHVRNALLFELKVEVGFAKPLWPQCS
ncbi:hypothetical protein P3T16_002216 [Paraburkholderia sp. GAS42]|jgi:hypothetical protein